MPENQFIGDGVRSNPHDMNLRHRAFARRPPERAGKRTASGLRDAFVIVPRISGQVLDGIHQGVDRVVLDLLRALGLGDAVQG